MRIKNLPSIESMDGSQDALVIEQTDGSEDKSRKVSPAQIKQYVQTGDFEATGEVKDGHGNILAGKQNTLTFDNVPTQNSNNPVKSGGIYSKIGDLTQTGLTGDSVAEQLDTARGQIATNAFPNIVRTDTVTGTTNAYGDVALSLTPNYLVLSVAEYNNGGGCFVIPRQVESGYWWACVYRGNAKVANTAVSLQVRYVKMT